MATTAGGCPTPSTSSPPAAPAPGSAASITCAASTSSHLVWLRIAVAVVGLARRAAPHAAARTAALGYARPRRADLRRLCRVGGRRLHGPVSLRAAADAARRRRGGARCCARSLVARPARAVVLGRGAGRRLRLARRRASTAPRSSSGADNGIDSPGFLRSYTADRAADRQVVRPLRPARRLRRRRWRRRAGLVQRHPLARLLRPLRRVHRPRGAARCRPSRSPEVRAASTTSFQHARPSSPRATTACPAPQPSLHRGRRQAVASTAATSYVTVEVPGLSGRSYCHPSMSCPFYTFLKRTDRTVGPFGPISGEID